MAGRRIAGFLTDNDSNACHGALRESPKEFARGNVAGRRKSSVEFEVGISPESAFRRRVAANSPIPDRRHAGDMIQARRKPLFEIGSGVEADARPSCSTHHDGAD